MTVIQGKICVATIRTEPQWEESLSSVSAPTSLPFLGLLKMPLLDAEDPSAGTLHAHIIKRTECKLLFISPGTDVLWRRVSWLFPGVVYPPLTYYDLQISINITVRELERAVV